MRRRSAYHQRAWQRVAGIVLLLLCASSCGGRPAQPKRGVLEKGIGTWSFGRYQQLLDVEVWVPKNPGVAHTASYVQKDALKRGRVDEQDVVHAFVTRYSKNAGIQRQLLVFVRRLAREAGYMVEEDRVKKVRLIKVSGHGESWVLWAAKRHVIKLGGQAIETVPSAIISSYAKRYPSRLQPGILEGALPAGEEDPGNKKQNYDDKHPEPDWEEYRDKQSGADK